MRELRAQGSVLQTHEYSCGAAALATLMGIFGAPAGEMEVLHSIFGKQLPIVKGRDGKAELRALTVEDLEIGAKRADFKVVSLQVDDPKQAALTLKTLRPAIARLHLYNEYLHFVVLRDIKDGWVHISDPAYGNVKITLSQFDKAWAAGDRVLLTIGKLPFQIWREKGNEVFIKRDDEDVIEADKDLGPDALYRTVQARLPQLGNAAQ